MYERLSVVMSYIRIFEGKVSAAEVTMDRVGRGKPLIYSKTAALFCNEFLTQRGRLNGLTCRSATQGLNKILLFFFFYFGWGGGGGQNAPPPPRHLMWEKTPTDVRRNINPQFHLVNRSCVYRHRKIFSNKMFLHA